MPLRIVSWNIRAGGGSRVGEIAAQLQRWRADVAVLQEFRATPPSRKLAELLAGQGLVHQRTTADPGQAASNRLLIASRWPLRRLHVASAPAELGRWLLVRVAATAAFSLAAVHVPNRVSGRKYPFLDAVLGVARRWRGGAGLIVGDTNSGRIGIDEQAPAFNQREDAWIVALEAAGWRDAFRHLRGETRVYSWHAPNGGNGFRLDEAFVNARLMSRVRDARYAWGSIAGSRRRDALSDHAALILELD